MIYLEYLIVITLGLVLGSFASAMAYRVPRGLPWAFSKTRHLPSDVSAYHSNCTRCKKRLSAIDLIPVVSWFLTKGRCRYCKEKISPIYPLLEIGMALACLGIYWAVGFSLPGMFLIAVLPFLMALLVVDLEYMILPNQLVSIAGTIGLIYLVTKVLFFHEISWGYVWFHHIFGAIVYAGLIWFIAVVMEHFLDKETLGFGDVKFFAVAGLWLGLANLPWFCLFSGIFGVIFALIWQVLKKEKVFPFGPALIVSFYFVLLLDGSLLL